jgi:hypothetical protein
MALRVTVLMTGAMEEIDVQELSGALPGTQMGKANGRLPMDSQ